MALRYRFEGRVGMKLAFFFRRLGRLILFWRKEQELSRFLAAEGLTPISREERARFPAYQRCQACSLCTFSCAAVRDGLAPPAFEPKYLMLGLGREDAVVDDWIPCAQCSGCTVECPVDVPIHEIAERIRVSAASAGTTEATASPER